uniref:Uncharacterized protein n=1 Tax=Romanomermis culicivorax TaxID=13658 RepID=A0A915KYG8_ROMCU
MYGNWTPVLSRAGRVRNTRNPMDETEVMLLRETASLKKTPEHISTKLEFNEETAMAVESLTKDVAQETKVLKTENQSQMDVIQLESNTEDISENDTVTKTPTMQTTSSMTRLLKSLLYSTQHIDWHKKEEYRAKAARQNIIAERYFE